VGEQRELMTHQMSKDLSNGEAVVPRIRMVVYKGKDGFSATSIMDIVN
jgi:hypothetical protein